MEIDWGLVEIDGGLVEIVGGLVEIVKEAGGNPWQPGARHRIVPSGAALLDQQALIARMPEEGIGLKSIWSKSTAVCSNSLGFAP